MTAIRIIIAIAGAWLLMLGAGGLLGAAMGSEVWVLGQSVGAGLNWYAALWVACIVAGLLLIAGAWLGLSARRQDG